MHVTSEDWSKVGIGQDPRGDGDPTCKIAGIAYTGSNPVPATQSLSCAERGSCPALSGGLWDRVSLQFPSARRYQPCVAPLAARPGGHLGLRLWLQSCLRFITWRPWQGRACCTVALAAGPSDRRLVSLFRLPALPRLGWPPYRPAACIVSKACEVEFGPSHTSYRTLDIGLMAILAAGDGDATAVGRSDPVSVTCQHRRHSGCQRAPNGDRGRPCRSPHAPGGGHE